jgi:hypothetical protein
VLVHPAALRFRELCATAIAAHNRVGDFTLGPATDHLLRERKDSAYVGVIGADDGGTTASASFAVNTVLTIALPALSWHLFEAPLNGLKRHLRLRAANQVGRRVSRSPKGFL